MSDPRDPRDPRDPCDPANAESFLEQNLALLRRRYPGLAELYTENTGGGGNFRVEPSAAGDPTLVYTGSPDIGARPVAAAGIPASAEAGIPAANILVHSRRDPVREGRRQADAALAEGAKDSAFIVLGFGLGYTACALAKSLGDGEDGKTRGFLVIVERRKELFRLALERRDLSELLSPGRTVFVIGGENSGAVTGVLAMLENQLSSRQKPVIVKNRPLISLSAEDESWYGEAERRILSWASKDEINAATLKRFGKRWTRNLGANLSGIPDYPGVTYVGGILAGTGIPVFLAAAGPSLDNAAPLLRSIHERCVTVAVDTSLRFLTQRGLEPDFVVSVDPQYWNARHLYRAPKTALIAESAVYPPVLRGGTAAAGAVGAGFCRTFLCQSLFPLGRFIEDRTDPKGGLGAGGSVATTAWDFARLLGPPAVWIAGLDLGFPARRTHFKGALFEEQSHALSYRFRPAETLSVLSLESGFPFSAASADGGKVLTDRKLSLYGAWFENRFGQEQNLVSYSLSPKGLAVPGLVLAEVEELLSLPPRREEISRILRGVYARIDGEFYAPENRRDREQRYAAALESLISGLKTIREEAEKAEKLAAGAKRPRPGSAGMNREHILERLDAANRAIAVNPVKDAAGFLFPPPEELEKKLSETDPWKRHLEFSVFFYQELAAAADWTLKALERDLPHIP